MNKVDRTTAANRNKARNIAQEMCDDADDLVSSSHQISECPEEEPLLRADSCSKPKLSGESGESGCTPENSDDITSPIRNSDSQHVLSNTETTIYANPAAESTENGLIQPNQVLLSDIAGATLPSESSGNAAPKEHAPSGDEFKEAHFMDEFDTSTLLKPRMASKMIRRRPSSPTLNYSLSDIGLPTVHHETLPSAMLVPRKTRKRSRFVAERESVGSQIFGHQYSIENVNSALDFLASQPPLLPYDGQAQPIDQHGLSCPTVIEPCTESQDASETVLNATESSVEHSHVDTPSSGAEETRLAVGTEEGPHDLLVGGLEREPKIQRDACSLLYSLAEHTGSTTQLKAHRLQLLHNKGKSIYLNKQSKFLWPAPHRELENSWLFDSHKLLSNPDYDYLKDYEEEIELDLDLKLTKSPSFQHRCDKAKGTALGCDTYLGVLASDSFLLQNVLYEIDRINRQRPSHQQLNLSSDTKMLIAREAVSQLEKVLLVSSEMHDAFDKILHPSSAHKQRKSSHRTSVKKMDWRTILNAMSYADSDNERLIEAIESRMIQYTREGANSDE